MTYKLFLKVDASISGLIKARRSNTRAEQRMCALAYCWRLAICRRWSSGNVGKSKKDVNRSLMRGYVIEMITGGDGALGGRAGPPFCAEQRAQHQETTVGRNPYSYTVRPKTCSRDKEIEHGADSKLSVGFIRANIFLEAWHTAFMTMLHSCMPTSVDKQQRHRSPKHCYAGDMMCRYYLRNWAHRFVAQVF